MYGAALQHLRCNALFEFRDCADPMSAVLAGHDGMIGNALLQVETVLAALSAVKLDPHRSPDDKEDAAAHKDARAAKRAAERPIEVSVPTMLR
jgi:hypothetical protein